VRLRCDELQATGLEWRAQSGLKLSRDLEDNDQRHGAAKLVNIAQPLWMDLKFGAGYAYGEFGILISLSRFERLTPHASSFTFTFISSRLAARGGTSIHDC